VGASPVEPVFNFFSLLACEGAALDLALYSLDVAPELLAFLPLACLFLQLLPAAFFLLLVLFFASRFLRFPGG
jgi:hypothetical protein